jgi:hypothetical protein
MKEGARSILEAALTNAVAGPMTELQRKNQRAMGALLALGAAWIVTSVALVQARDQSAHLSEAMGILEQGYRVKPSPSPLESFVMPWTLDDGTTMYLNVPRPLSAETSA